MNPLRLAIVVRGGLVKEVFCTHSVLANVVDWDLGYDDPDAPQVIEVRVGGESKFAWIGHVSAGPWVDLPGTPVGAALEAADFAISDAARESFASRELATVLAALRHWQEITRQANLGEAVIQYIPANLQLHFADHAPLSHEEIDELCMQLNGSPDVVSVRSETCECEGVGFYCCGVPGVLAHFENGRLSPDHTVERCGVCRRFSSDEAALARLRELRLA